MKKIAIALLLLCHFIVLASAQTTCLKIVKDKKKYLSIDSIDELKSEVAKILNRNSYDTAYFENGGEDHASVVLATKTKDLNIQEVSLHHFISGKLYISSSDVARNIFKSDRRLKNFPSQKGCRAYLDLKEKKNLDKIIKIEISSKKIIIISSYHKNSKSYEYIEAEDLYRKSKRLIKNLIRSRELSASLLI